ncbi:hypothetical protein ACFFWC_10135 [Plantactinospora siamensis]|uniref:ABC transmembrane type-1 domain-containing protein n=1 Tax=Plantactinospora siamensis TaxID=555372 RepID=A0ABV6NWK9_9ACTN
MRGAEEERMPWQRPGAMGLALSREQERARPLYARVLGLRHVDPGGVLCFAFFEGSVILALLLALAELVSWWTILALPLAVAVMVKLNDEVASALTRSAARVPERERERFRRQLAPAVGRAPVPPAGAGHRLRGPDLPGPTPRSALGGPLDPPARSDPVTRALTGSPRLTYVPITPAGTADRRTDGDPPVDGGVRTEPRGGTDPAHRAEPSARTGNAAGTERVTGTTPTPAAGRRPSNEWAGETRRHRAGRPGGTADAIRRAAQSARRRYG